MKILRLLFFILIVDTGCLYAQADTALITALVKNIEAAQFKQDGTFYAGMFPAYRRLIFNQISL